MDFIDSLVLVFCFHYEREGRAAKVNFPIFSKWANIKSG